MSLQLILGLLGGGAVGAGAAYFIQNGKIDKLQRDLQRYGQAEQALVSAEGELKDAKARILILEQSEHEGRRKLEQAYQGQLEDLQASYQSQMAELSQMRSLKLEMEQELTKTHQELENAQNTYFNDLEALRQSYQSQIGFGQSPSSATADLDSLHENYQNQIAALESSYEERIQTIEQAHQEKIYELEQAYQTQILGIQAAQGDEFDDFAPPSVSESFTEEALAPEPDFAQTFINPALLEDDDEEIPQGMAYLETWVAPFQDEEAVIPTDSPREIGYAETWFSPQEEEEEGPESGISNNYTSPSHLETWISPETNAEIVSTSQEMGYLETWVAEEEETPFHFTDTPVAEEEESLDLNFLESLQPETSEEIARISSLEELTSPNEDNFNHYFSQPDQDFLELLPQEEETDNFAGLGLVGEESVEELFSLSAASGDDLDLLNSLELELNNPSEAQDNLGFAEADSDLDFLNLLDAEPEGLESLTADDANASFDDLFGEDLLNSAWDSELEDDNKKIAKTEYL